MDKDFIEIKINNILFKVYFIDPEYDDDDILNFNNDNEKTLGMVRRSHGIILIDNNLNEDLLIRTIDHEVTHAFFWAYGLSQIDSFEEENICDFIESHARNIIDKSNYILNNFKEKYGR